ncbi:MAG: UPF0758 domain-containing protein, partial [Pseudomonadota bacterium]
MANQTKVGKSKPSARRRTVAGTPATGPRERLLIHGVRALSDSELLAVLIQHGVKGHSAQSIAESLLHSGG